MRFFWGGETPPGLAGGGGGGIGGSTGAADDRILTSDGTGGATLQASDVRLQGRAMSGHMPEIRTLDEDYTLVAADSGVCFNIRLVGGPATITTFAASQGFTFEVFVATADEVTIQFAGSQVAHLTGSVTTAAGTLKSSTLGSKIRLVYEVPNRWSCLYSGTWTAA